MTGSKGYSELAALTDEYIARLRAQLEDARADEKVKHFEAVKAHEFSQKIEAALRSVEALQVTELHVPSPQELSDADQKLIDHFTKWSPSSPLEDARTLVDDPPPPQLAPYVPAVGGKRLKSKLMIFDLLKKIGQPVTRDQLRAAFFEHYGRDDLERYWQRPDNALNTAIERAVADQYVHAVEVDGRETTYTIGWEDAQTGAPAFESGEGD